MLRIDALLFLLLVEAVLVSFAAVWYLMRRQRKRSEDERLTALRKNSLQVFLKSELDKVEAETERLKSELEKKSDADLVVSSEICAAQRRFIVSASDILGKNPDDELALWSGLLGVVEESSKYQLARIAGSEAERLKAVEKCRMIVGGTEKELKRLHGVIKDQEKKITGLKVFVDRVFLVRDKLKLLIEVTRSSETKSDMKTEIARIRSVLEMLAEKLESTEVSGASGGKVSGRAENGS